MAIKVNLLRYTPANNPDTAEVQLVPSGNYVANGDAVNLSPSAWSDPNGLGILGTPLTEPVTPPSVYGENNLGGYYTQLLPGATLAAAKLQVFSPGGADLGNNPYPAGMKAATSAIIVRVPLK